MDLTINHCRVLMLHRLENKPKGISGINKSWLKESIQRFLSKGFCFLSLEEFRKHIVEKQSFPPNALLVTIDDGYADQVHEMVPIFLEQGVKPAVFLITNLIDKKELPWDESIRYIAEHTQESYIRFEHLGGRLHYYFDSREARTWARRDFIARCELLSKDQLAHSIDSFSNAAKVAIPNAITSGYEAASIESIKTLNEQGASFSSHSDSHLILASNDDATCLESIDKAKQYIAQKGLEEKCFAYPIGKAQSFKGKQHIAREAGFDIAFTTVEGIATLEDDPFNLPRISYPLNEAQLESICSPMALYKYDQDNWLIKLHNIKTLKFLINEFGGKAAALIWLKHQLKNIFGAYRDQNDINTRVVKRVVFFCKGNINRSAVAETIFKQHSALPHASFGLQTEERFPPSVEAQRWARSKNIAILEHKTTKVEDFVFDDGDLIVGFEPDHIQQVKNRIDGKLSVQYSLLGMWAKPKWAYIHDPVARPEQYFEKCFNMIALASENLALNLSHN